MKKEAYYFSHDFNARNDPKLQAVLYEHGLAGIGLYWCIVEQLYEQGGTLQLDMIKGIAFSLHSDVETITSLLNSYGLFKDDGEVFWSDSVNARISKASAISEKRRQSANRRWDALQSGCKSNANALQSGCKSNAIKRKENKEKENNNLKSPSKEGNLCRDVASNNTDPQVESQNKDGEIDEERDTKTHSEAITKGVNDSKLCEEIRKYYNESISRAMSSLPKCVTKLTGQRKQWLLARMQEFGEDKVKECIDKATHSSFLGGDNKTGFRADFGWIMRPNNFPKVLDGFYNNQRNNGTNSNTNQQKTLERCERQQEVLAVIKRMQAEDDAYRD